MDKVPLEEQKPEAPDLLPLMRYLEVLVQKYPQPITPKQLAKLAKVSLPAVSKVRKDLYRLCDTKSLASSRRKILLRNDGNTVITLGLAFYFDSNLHCFLLSSYGQLMWRKVMLDAYKGITKAIPDFALFFNENDALYVAGLVVRAISDSLYQIRDLSIDSFDTNSLRSFLIVQAIEVIQKFGPNLNRYLSDQENLEHILVIRDKLWHLALRVISNNVREIFSAFLSTLPDDVQKELYIQVYFHTAKFYLENNIFSTITREIQKAAANAKIPWRDSYSKLGALYTPHVGEPTLDETSRRQVVEA